MHSNKGSVNMQIPALVQLKLVHFQEKMGPAKLEIEGLCYHATFNDKLTVGNNASKNISHSSSISYL